MRKLLKSLAYFATAALVGTSALADYGWYGTSIDIGGIRSDYSTWSQGHGAPDTDLGKLSDLTVTGVEMKVWDDSNDRGGANMFFRLYGDNGQIGQDKDLWLGAATRITGDHDFSVTYTGTIDLATEFGVQLEEGKTYYLTMWAKTYGDAGDHWYSGEYSDNFHTKFVYSAPKTYTLVESADDLVVGADYLVVSTVDGAYSAMKNEVNGTGLGCLGLADDAISGNTISASSDAIVWQLNPGNHRGQRVWYNAAEDVHAAAPATAGDNAQLLADGTDDLAQWTVDTSALPAVKVFSVSYDDRYLQRDSTAGNAWFAAYDSAQATPSLYMADSTEVQTVTFDPNGGTYYEDMLTMKYVKGRPYWGIWKPADREGYKFLGWYDGEGTRFKNDMIVTEDDTLALHAEWAEIQTVTFNANGGTLGGGETRECYINGVYSGFEKPSRTGYEFVGWFDENGQRVLNGEAVTADAERTLFAHWGQTVNFDGNGGTVNGSTSRICDIAGTYSGFVRPTRVGYDFMGWFDENGQRVLNGDDVTADAERTLFAHWGQTVRFEGNGGTVSGSTSRICDIAGTYSGFVMPTWAGHTFLGWFDEDGQRVRNGEDVTDDAERTLYAHWNESAAPLAISGFSMGFRSRAAARGTTMVKDTLDRALTGIASGGGYNTWSGKTNQSDAVYAGQSGGANNSIQLRSNNSNSGIVTTKSGGKVRKVTIDWNSNTQSGRTNNIYGKNTAYTQATDLYGNNAGTLIGTIVCGTSTNLSITDDYAYIGIRSDSGALYMNKVEIEWEVTTGDQSVTLSPIGPIDAVIGDEVTIAATPDGFGDATVTWSWTVDGAAAASTGSTFTWNTAGLTAKAYVVKATATAGELTASAEATVNLTAPKHTITIASGIEHGTVTTSPSGEASEGATVTVNASPAAGYQLESITVNDVALADGVTTFTMPTENVTVSATFVAFDGDVLTRATTGVASGGGYANWTATGTSGTKYAGNSAGGNDSIQMRVQSPSGIVITNSTGRDVKSVTVEWESNTAAARTNQIYGKTTPYTGPADLYGNDKGTLLGEIARDETTFAVPAGYPYIGILAKGGAVYLTSVTIEFAPAAPSVTLSPSGTQEVDVGDPAVTITATAENFSGPVTWSWTVNGTPVDGYTAATYTVGTSVADEYEITATATDGTNTKTSAPVTVKVNAPAAKYAITIDPDILQYATVTTDPAGEAAENVEVTVNVTPNAGYVLDVIKVNGTEITGNTFNMPAAAVTVSAEFSAVPTYTLVESADDVVVGADYLIVAYGTGYTNAMKGALTTTSTKRLDVEDITTLSADGKTIATPSDAIVWQLKPGNHKGQRVWFSATAEKFAAAPTSESSAAAQLLADGTNDLAQWTFDLTDMTAVKIASVSYTSRYLQRNRDAANRYFASYAAGQAYPRLYRADSTRLQTVTFDPNGGTYYEDMLTMKYVKGRPYWGIWKPADREGYKFLGWYDGEGTRFKNDMIVTEDDTLALHAEWAEIQTLTFDANGGTLGGKETQECYIGGLYSGFEKPSRVGYEFVGWFDEDGQRVLNGDGVTADTERTLFAHWGQTVNFDGNGGTVSGRTSLVCDTAGAYAGFVQPSRVGYAFMGWFDEDGQRVLNGDDVTADAERTLFAHWGQTVNFEGNGGTVRGRTSLVCDTAGVYAGFVMPTWDGHTFLGWFDEDDQRVKNGDDVTEDAARTLWAHWKESAAPLSISGFSVASRSTPAARDARGDGEQVFNLRFETVAGFVYEVQWTSALDGEWTALKRWTAEDGMSEVTVTVPASPAGFLRLAMFDEVE